MALKKHPGGVLYETDGGAWLNEEAGVNLEAIHRQLGAQAAAALDEARRTRWTVTRDHTLIFAVESASDLAVNPERNTLTFKIGA